MSSLKDLTDLELHDRARQAVETESKATLSMIDHLIEVDRRRLYLTLVIAIFATIPYLNFVFLNRAHAI